MVWINGILCEVKGAHVVGVCGPFEEMEGLVVRLGSSRLVG